MARRVEVTVDLGAGAPVEVIRQVVDDLDTVCQFAGELQFRAVVAEAEWAILRRPTGWITDSEYDEYLFAADAWGGPMFGRRGSVAIPAAILAPAVSRYLDENNATQDTITTVESIRYSNPMEFVLGVGIVAAVVVLRTIRDWPARRRLNAALAADVENHVLARKELRDEVVRRAVDGNIRLSAQQIDDLLTLDVARAMSALGDSRFSMRELESDVDESEPG